MTITLQQLISELTDEFEEDESGDKPKRKETLVKNLLRKVEGAVEESLPEATEVRTIRIKSLAQMSAWDLKTRSRFRPACRTWPNF